MSDKTGGPAFPLTVSNTNDHDVQVFGENVDPETTVQFTGMTLRDYFAAKAMQAMVANYGYSRGETGKLAENTYDIADAMLKERAK